MAEGQKGGREEGQTANGKRRRVNGEWRTANGEELKSMYLISNKPGLH